MDWKLVLQLSGFGFAMAIATVWVIPSSIEPLFWLGIFVACALIIARRLASRHALHGFMVSLVNAVWVTAAHILFYRPYLARHADEAAMLASGPMPDSPRLMMLITGPVIGVVTGLVLALFCFVAAKVIRRPPA